MALCMKARPLQALDRGGSPGWPPPPGTPRDGRAVLLPGQLPSSALLAADPSDVICFTRAAVAAGQCMPLHLVADVGCGLRCKLWRCHDLCK